MSGYLAHKNTLTTFLRYHLILKDEPFKFKILVSVPKKFIKKAHDRNYIKRCMREGIRKNKSLIEELLLLKEISVDIALVYICKERKEAEEIQIKIIDNLKKIRNELQKNTG
jgi:ribonuclease P protein component